MVKRWLKGSNIHIVDPIIEAQGWTPLPDSTILLIAFDEKGIAGFHALRMVPHPEPLYVREDLRDGELSSELAADMSKFLDDTGTNGIMVVAENAAAEDLCKSLGMKKLTSPVYVR